MATKYTDTINYIQLGPAPTSTVTADSVSKQIGGSAIAALSSQAGIPIVTQAGQTLLGSTNTYSVSDITQMNRTGPTGIFSPIKYLDFRARKAEQTPNGLSRFDGAGAIIRGSVTAAKYLAASTTVGAYSIFNLEQTYGWGDHGSKFATRKDFTAGSHVRTIWSPGSVKLVSPDDKPSYFTQPKGNWIPTNNPLELSTSFRGDKVTVIDFGTRTLKEAYLWRPKTFQSNNDVSNFFNRGSLTQDFIKFYFTGPKLHAGNKTTSVEDDIIVFRASINSFGDTFGGNWNGQQMIGRADPNYHYTGYDRDISLDFSVYATDRDEMKPIWRKLNALAGYTAPEYDNENIGLVGPWLRITVGDILYQQAIAITSLNYTYYDADSPWEQNIEKDPTMMQVPFKVNVSLSAKLITDWLPQKGGRFFSLAQKFRENAQPIPGNHNWLSDTKETTPLSQEELQSLAQDQVKDEKLLKTLTKKVEVLKDNVIKTKNEVLGKIIGKI